MTPVRALLLKELNESRAALWIGLAWMIWPLAFYLGPHVSKFVQVFIQSIAMMIPLGCVLLLATGRFLIERQQGTWDFLRAQPVSMRQVVVLKWALSLALIAVFSTVSAAVAYAPLSRNDEQVAEFPLGVWVAFHAVAVVLFAAMLLALDTIDWGEHLILRSAATVALLLFALIEINSAMVPNWRDTLLFSLIVVSLFSTAALWAPRLRAEGSRRELGWNWNSRISARRFTPSGAWRWLQWRQVRATWALPTLFVLLLLGVDLAIGQGMGRWESLQEAMRNALAPMSGIAVLALFAAGSILGIMPAAKETEASAAFLHALPVDRARGERSRLLIALGLMCAAVLVPLLVFIAHGMLVTHSTPGAIAVKCANLLLRAAALLVLTYCGVRVLGFLNVPVLLFLPMITLPLFFAAEQYQPIASSLMVSGVCLATVVAAVVLAPHLGGQRELPAMPELR